MKPLLIIQTATSYDDLPNLCQTRGDEIDWFSEGCEISKNSILTVKVFKGELLPPPETVQAAIITGSVDMISDNYKWMRTTAEWLKQASVEPVPILGICFGHQLISHAFGGWVGPNPNGAMFGTVSITNNQSDPLFDALPQQVDVQAFHYESILTLPAGASILAHNEHDPHYACRFSDNVWGVQFHPEFDTEIMQGAYDVYAEDIEKEGFNLDSLRTRTRNNAYGSALLKEFIKLAYKSKAH